MQHELFRYATPGIMLVLAFTLFAAVCFDDVCFDAKNDLIQFHSRLTKTPVQPGSECPEGKPLFEFKTTTFLTILVVLVVPLGWPLYNGYRFLWAFRGDFETLDSMKRLRKELRDGLEGPDDSGRYIVRLGGIRWPNVRHPLPERIVLTADEFHVLFDPYQPLLRIPRPLRWLSYRWRHRNDYEWLFTEHINHLFFFRDPSSDYTRAFASNFQAWHVALLALAYGWFLALAVHLWAPPWYRNAWLWVPLLVLLVFNLLYALFCDRENNARSLLTSVLMLPEPGRVAMVGPLPSQQDLASRIEHTNLESDATEQDIKRLCGEARSLGFYGVCVNPCYVHLAKRELADTSVRTCTVVGFPLGANVSSTKLKETEQALQDGADEIDVVMNIGLFKSDRISEVEKELSDIVRATASKGKVCKVIIETGLLNAKQIAEACEMLNRTGATFIKTSTGFGKSGGVTVHALEIVNLHRGRLKVKAAGGIRDLDTAVSMLRTGADRLGTSHGVSIMSRLIERQQKR